MMSSSRRKRRTIAWNSSALALAAGFANAKLHIEMARAPLLAKEMRGVTVKGFVELYNRYERPLFGFIMPKEPASKPAIFWSR